MSIVYGLPAFLMSRICERGARNFGRESRRGELYAAAVLGTLLLLLVMSTALVVNAFVPGLVDLKSAKFSRLGLVLIWTTATVVAYVLFVPDRRYRKWSEDFKSEHTIARERPALIEVLAIATVLAVLVASVLLNWVTDVLLKVN